MSFLSAAEIALIKADVAQMLPDTCNLGTMTNTSDGEGGFSEARATVSTNVPCRLDSKVTTMEIRGREQMAAGQIMPFHTNILTLPGTAIINTSYWAQVGSNYYQVRSIDFDKSWKVSIRAFVEIE